MKKKVFTLTLILFSLVSIAQNQNKQINSIQQIHVSDNENYQLFPTENYWTFLKLDTRNGKMWQVHFSIGDEDNSGEFVLNPLPLVSEAIESKGRFTLISTKNIYNFLLFDQIDGTVTQVQWSMEKKKRGIIRIIKPVD